MAGMDAASVDAIVTDPPYGLSFMGKDWDHGIPGPPFWEQARRVAKPGAYLLAFGGTRTYHRLTCAIEDAGWEIKDCLMWLYGSGFPKHKSLLKPGYEPIVLAKKPGAGMLNIDVCRIAGDEDGSRNRPPSRLGSERTYAQDEWTRTAVVPGNDTTGLGRWPANVVLDEDAAAALDAMSGISGEKSRVLNRNGARQMDGWGLRAESKGIVHGDTGGASRFFFTVRHDPNTVQYDLNSQAERGDDWDDQDRHLNIPLELDTPQTRGTTGSMSGTPSPSADGQHLPTSSNGNVTTDPCPTDSKFTTSTKTNRTTTSPISNSLTRSPTNGCIPGASAPMTADGSSRALSAANSNPSMPSTGTSTGADTHSTDGADPATSAKLLPINNGAARFAYIPKASRRERNEGLDTPSTHPTVKPVTLMRWLVRLVTPPGGTVLDPFAGSGTTGIACAIESLGFVGIEQNAEYVEIAERRIAYWTPEPLPLFVEAS